MEPRKDEVGREEGEGDDRGEEDVPEHSWGNIGEHHWSRAREGMNTEAMEYLRERSRAPGVEEGGAERNHYCMSCNGVIPLSYYQTRPASEELEHCPHCGVELDTRVRAMFNWVEIDQVPKGDLMVLLPWGIGGVAVVAAVLWYLLG